MLRNSGPPQSELEERAAVLLEAAWLTGTVIRITCQLPRVVARLFERDEGLDVSRMTTEELGKLCADIRAECRAAGCEIDAAGPSFSD